MSHTSCSCFCVALTPVGRPKHLFLIELQVARVSPGQVLILPGSSQGDITITDVKPRVWFSALQGSESSFTRKVLADGRTVSPEKTHGPPGWHGKGLLGADLGRKGCFVGSATERRMIK